MSTTGRDTWADAYAAATEPHLEGDLAVVRRRIWWRRAAATVASLALVVSVFLGLERLPGLQPDGNWQLAPAWLGFGLAGLGILVLVVAGARSLRAGVDEPLVTPDAFLTRRDRAWLRSRIAAAEAVPADRREVAAELARRMVAERILVVRDAGLLCFYLGMLVSIPLPVVVLSFAVLSVWMLVRMVRRAVWSVRGRRWLALDA